MQNGYITSSSSFSVSRMAIRKALRSLDVEFWLNMPAWITYAKKKTTTQNTRSNSISIPFLMLLYRLILNNRIMPKDRCFLNIFFVHGEKKYLRIPKAARSNFIVHCPANWPAVNSVECKMMCWLKTDLFINIKLISCGSKDLLFNTVHCHEPQNTNFVLLANTMSTILSLEILEQENSRKVQIYSLRLLDGREANKKIGQIC